MYRTLLATCGSAERHCAQRKGTALSGKARYKGSRSNVRNSQRVASANQSRRAREPIGPRSRSADYIPQRNGNMPRWITKRHSLTTECLRQSHEQRREKSEGRGVRTWQVIQKNGNEKHKKRNARNWHILRVGNFEPPIG